MIRNVSLEDISDGKLYSANDMVKADCQDCRGCSACCRGMGSSIVLDPLDVHRMVTKLRPFEELMAFGAVELQVVDGIILPNLKMNGETEQCAFLDDNGRCSIHAVRPGICRLFPLGRFYDTEARTFSYFLQVNECKKENRTKVKVKKWIDTPEFSRYEAFVAKWHYFLLDLEKMIGERKDDGLAKQVSLYVLKEFYMKSFDGNRDFYDQFEERMNQAQIWAKNA